MNHYPHNMGDYLKDTLGLTMQQDGAYRRLLDQYYSSEKPLPLAKTEIYGLARCMKPGDREAVDFVLARYFVERPDGYRQKRADIVLDELISKSQSASRSAKSRWSERNANGDANASQTHSERNADGIALAMLDKNQEPRTKNQDRASAARKRAIPPDFAISDRVMKWAAEKGFGSLNHHLEYFISKAKAKGYTYADWDEAFMGAIAKDWAELRRGVAQKSAKADVAGQIFPEGLSHGPDETDITAESKRIG